MPYFEYVVGVTPPGTRITHYHHGIFSFYRKDEAQAAEYAIHVISERYGYNVKHQYSCVIKLLETEDF